MTPPSPEDIEKAVGAYHLHCLGDMIAWAVSMAAERHPIELRAAFAKVFSSEAVETSAKNALLVARQARQAADQTRQYAQEAVELMKQVSRQIDAVEMKLDALQMDVDQMA